MRFEEELSSLDDVPSTDTSLNGAAAGIESVGMKETAETSGAETGEVRKNEKRNCRDIAGQRIRCGNNRQKRRCIRQENGRGGRLRR